MKRIGVLVVVVLFASGASGCGLVKRSGSPPPVTPAASGPASGSPGGPAASATPSASPAPAVEFTVDGAGPYQLGTVLGDLQSKGLLDEVRANGEICPGNTSARGTGVWKDIRLSFRTDGKLYLATNRSAAIPTPSGAWVGSTLAQLKTIYPTLGAELSQGPAKAFLVTTISGRGILFDLDPGLKVMAMLAADAEYLKDSYLGGTDFC